MTRKNSYSPTDRDDLTSPTERTTETSRSCYSDSSDLTRSDGSSDSGLQRNQNAAIKVSLAGFLEDKESVGSGETTGDLRKKERLSRLATRFLVEEKKFFPVSGAIVCTLLSLCGFAVLYLSAGLTAKTAGITTAAIFLASLICYVFSRLMRCVFLLSLPSLCGARGRSVIWCIILGVLMRGPVANIFANLNEVSRGLSCQGEIMYNQTKQFQAMLRKPFDDFARRMTQAINKLSSVSQNIRDAAKPVTDTIELVFNATKGVRGLFTDFSEKCSGAIGSAKGECVKFWKKVHSDCDREVGKFFGPIEETLGNAVKDGIRFATELGSEIAKGFNTVKSAVVGVANAIGDGVVEAVETVGNAFENFGNAFVDFFGRKRRRKRRYVRYITDTFMDCGQHELLNRTKRGLASDVLCAPVKLEATCDILDIPNAICNLPGGIEELIRKAEEKFFSLKAALDLDFDFEIQTTISGDVSANSSKSMSGIRDSVQGELETITSVVSLVTDIFGKLFAASILFVLLKAFLYRRAYLRKLIHDNTYLTKEMVDMDKTYVKKGQPPVFPLHKRQAKKYTFVTSKALTTKERRFLKMGFIVLFVQIITATCIMLVDYTLYWFMSVLQKHGRESKFQSDGLASIKFGIEGSSGVFADSLTEIVDTVNGISVGYNNTLDIAQCFPKPSASSTRHIYLVACLFAFSFVLLTMQAYSMRLSHKIMDIFQPKRRLERINYLYDKIRTERYGRQTL